MKIFTKFINYHKAILIVTLLMSAFAQAQLKNSFDPRFNEAVNGDFTIIANNTISTTATGDYNGTSDNNQISTLVYVDIDSDNTTFNSSSANFVNPAPTASCLTIKKVLLYWAAADQEPNTNNPASENQPNWNYNDIKLMLPSETAYTTYTADEVIYRGREDHVGPPHDGHFSNDPYICVKDITSSVTDLVDNSISPYGTYQVANVEGKIGALNDHDTNIPTGVSGGWQIVFVYESPTLPLKNISIFDGYGHVVNGQGSYNIDFNGFQTVPAGDVNANILIGALEGDLGLNGDRLQIENTANAFVDLSTSPTSPIRATNNFFNSKITIDNANFTNRTPASTNTLGFDAAIFELSNPSNTIIGNNQTSATFRLTSTQETYGLFLLGMSIDVWSPNLGPIHLTLDTPNTSLNPSTTFGASFTVENTGNDDAKSLEVSTTLPPQVTLVEPITPALPAGITYNYNTTTNVLEFFVADGIADAGAPAVIVDFDLQVRDECYFLETSCDLQFELQLEANYIGSQNPTPQSTVSSANLDTCGVGILDPIVIDVTQPTISWDTAVNTLDRELECNDVAGLNTAQALEPQANKCNLTLTKTSGVFVPNPTCPSTGTYTNTWNFTDACGVTISDYVQTITIVNTTPLVIPADGASTVECIADATETFTFPTVSDACGNVLSPFAAVITENPDPLTCEGTRTYTYTYTDCAGNTADWAYVYTIDTPAFSIADADGAATVECIADADGSGIVLPTVTDACNNSLTPSAPVVTDSPDPLTCEGTRTYTYTYTDCAGNSDTWDFVYTIDTPAFSIADADGAATVECIANADGSSIVLPTVTDACNNPLTPSAPVVTDSPDPLTCEGTRTYTYTYTDCAGNSDTWDFVYTIDLSVFSLPANGIETVDNLADAVEPTPPAVTDNCGNLLTPSTPTVSATPDCQGSVVYAFTFTDCAGNTADWTYTYTIELAPFTVPANGGSTVNCIADATETFTLPTVTDANGDTITPAAAVITENPDPLTCEGTRTYTYTYTDCAGNTADWAYVYTIDTPAFSIADADEAATVECIDDADGSGIVPPTVTDACNNTLTPSAPVVTDSPDPLTCEGTRTYTYTYTDCAGNSDTWAFVYTIDTPAFSIADADGAVTVECIDDADGSGIVLPTVTDACNNSLTPSAPVVTDSPDPLTCEGTRTYTYTYTDCAGNSDTWAFVYTIDLSVFSLPANGTETVDNLADAVEPTPPAVTDNCGNLLTPSTPTVSATPDCQGSVVYAFTFTDCAGNTADWTYTYTIELAPFTVPANGGSTVNCIADATAPIPPVIADANGDNITPIMTEGADPACEGDKIYTFTYTDCAGNTADWLYTYTIDIPTFNITDADGASTVDCIADADGSGIVLPTVTDACNNILTAAAAIITENPDPLTCEGTRTYTYTYTDCAGNSDTWAFVYTIDTPAFTIPDADGASTVECIDDATETFTLPTVNDTCGNLLSPSTAVITETPGSTACEIIRTYTYTYTDCAGNSDTWTFVYTIKDTTPPVLTLPANQTAECSDNLTPIAFGTATATDNCDANPIITFVDVRTDGACPGTFTITRTWTATDVCGNEASANQVISTSDTTAPEFEQTTLPGNITVECNGVPDAEILTATDNCGTADVTVEDVRTDGNCANNYTITRTYTATDECGLTNTHIQTITVQDSTPPAFEGTLPDINKVVECDAVPDAETLTATDTCGSATVTVDDVRTDGNCPNNYIIARTWIATDECGLTTTHTQIITVQDTTPPTFEGTLPATSATVECDAIPNAETLTATDNCGDAIVTVEDVKTNGNCPNNYTIARTWTATDECGLTATHTQVITVQDTTAPVPTTTFEETLNVSCTDIPDVPELTFSDNCSTNIIVVFNETNSFDENVFADYEIVRSWTVRDECNNEEVYTQTLFVSLDEVVTEVVAPDWCYDEGAINMNNLLADGLNTNGTWELLEGDTTATLNGSVFDPSNLELSLDFLPESGGIDYKFRYTTTDEGCISITEVTMNVHADCVVLPCGENDITISKAVTPNGDAYNEYFEISGIELCGFIYDVKIFNRWGALVYESDNYQNDWNGTTSSASIGAAGKVPNGTYYYIIKLQNSGLNPITGPVYLGTK